MKRQQNVRVFVLVIALVGISVAYWLHRASSATVPPSQLTQFQNAFEGSIGQVVFAKEPPTGRPVLADEDNSTIDKFTEYARLFDTFANARHIANTVLPKTEQLHGPTESSALTWVPAEIRLDSWGHPFCVVPLADRVAVISAGAENQSFSCDQLKPDKAALARAEPSSYETESGEIVVVVDRTTAQGRNL